MTSKDPSGCMRWTETEVQALQGILLCAAAQVHAGTVVTAAVVHCRCLWRCLQFGMLRDENLPALQPRNGADACLIDRFAN